jgi:cellulose synthase/poly-beta-1,6-N-acetylglucosamine synthase-like glycosyltransferase
MYVQCFSTHNREPSGQLLRRKLSDSSIKRHALENNWGGPRTERVKSRDPFPEFELWREQIWHKTLNSLNEKTSPSPRIFCSPSIIYLFIYLLIFIFIYFCPLAYLFIYLSISLFIFLLLYLFIYFYSSVSLFIYSFPYLSIYIFTCLFFYFFVYFYLTVTIFIYLFIHLCVIYGRTKSATQNTQDVKDRARGFVARCRSKFRVTALQPRTPHTAATVSSYVKPCNLAAAITNVSKKPGSSTFSA